MGRLDEYFPEPSEYVNAYRALVTVLRKDPILQEIPITWDVREGARNEAMPPTQEMMPWIAVVPMEISGVRRETETDDQFRFKCRIDMAVAGTDFDDLANLAGAVRNALKYDRVSPDDTKTVCEFLQAAGINDYWVRQAGVGVKRTESTPPDTATAAPPPVIDQVASAVVEFQLLLPTLDRPPSLGGFEYIG